MGFADTRTAITAAIKTAGVAAIVGDRVYPAHGQPGSPERPYVVWTRAACDRQTSVTGNRATHGQITIRVECHCLTLASLDALTDAVLAACRSFRRIGGQLASFDAAGGPYDLLELAEGSNTFLPAASVDVAAVYREG